MRSAEQSGGEAERFRVQGQQSSRDKKAKKQVDGLLGRLGAAVPATTLAVAATAFAAATLFLAFDAYRTLNERQMLQELSLLLASDPTADSGSEAIATLERLQADDVVAGLSQRGAVVYGMALVAVGFTLGRRKKPQVAAKPDPHLLSSIPFGIACWSRDGELLVCNSQYREKVAFDGQPLDLSLSYYESISRLMHQGQMKIQSEEDGTRLYELRREDGTCILIEERPYRDGGFITLVTDVTDRRRTDALLTSVREEQRMLARRYHEEKLKAEAASRAKTSFLAHLSHDIRTPLNHIIGFAEVMRRETFGPLGDTRYLSYIEGMKGSGERLLDFFATILELAELEGGQKTLRQSPFNVDELLATVTRRFSSDAQRAGLTLKLGPASGVTLVGDLYALERMLSNIVENALRFTPSGGRVTLAAHVAEDGIVLEITDTGIGMTPDRVTRLSQPFAFGDDAFAHDTTGNGLGIAIARAIAELSGGHMAIDSEPAIGTTVAISLPLRETVVTVRAA